MKFQERRSIALIGFARTPLAVGECLGRLLLRLYSEKQEKIYSGKSGKPSPWQDLLIFSVQHHRRIAGLIR